MIEQKVLPALERSTGARMGEEFGFVVNPEFLREGGSIQDFDDPPFTLLGVEDQRAESVMRDLYRFLPAPVVVTDRRTATLVKYASNAFHAMKIAFANEVGRISNAAGADGQEVMRLFCLDQRLNLSRAYLKPGMPFGGSCLSKDVRAIVTQAQRSHLSVPLLAAVVGSNRAHADYCTRLILATGADHVGFLGLAFKAGTDDVRESPSVTIVSALLEAGRRVAIYDPSVALSRLSGANREYLIRHLPQSTDLIRSTLDEVVAESDVLVIGREDREFRRAAERKRAEQIVIDLVGKG